MTDDPLSHIYNHRQLTPRIATSGQPAETQLAFIADAGYEVIINLALHGTQYALPDERASVEGLGLAYENIPVVWESPTLENLDSFFEAMERCAAQRIWVHCVANFRVSAFMLLYRVLKLGWVLEDALPDMQALWEPYDAWPPFIEAALQRRSA